MFKMWFVNLCTINSQISLIKIKENKPYTKLNWTTVRLYHQLHGTGK